MTAIHQKQIARATARLRKFMGQHEGLSVAMHTLGALEDMIADVASRETSDKMRRLANERWNPTPKPAKVPARRGRPPCACEKPSCPYCKKRMRKADLNVAAHI